MCTITDEEDIDVSSGEEDMGAEDVGISALNKKQMQLAAYEEPDDGEREIIQQDERHGGLSHIWLYAMRLNQWCV